MRFIKFIFYYIQCVSAYNLIETISIFIKTMMCQWKKRNCVQKKEIVGAKREKKKWGKKWQCDTTNGHKRNHNFRSCQGFILHCYVSNTYFNFSRKKRTWFLCWRQSTASKVTVHEPRLSIYLCLFRKRNLEYLFIVYFLNAHIFTSISKSEKSKNAVYGDKIEWNNTKEYRVTKKNLLYFVWFGRMLSNHKSIM